MIMPGSLDYLYYNGILDHIPYEAYEMTPIASSAATGLGLGMNNYGVGSMGGTMPSAMQGNALGGVPMGQYGITNSYGQNSAGLITYPSGNSQYLDTAMQGSLYNSTGLNDTFVRNTYSQDLAGKNSYGMRGANNDESDIYGSDISSMKNSIKQTKSKLSTKIFSLPTILKGLLGVGIMLGTLVLILKGKKKP